MADVQNLAVSFALGLIACAAVIFLAVDFEEKSGKVMRFLSKYTMPIFLMYTLFAAPLRSILLKIGITNAVELMWCLDLECRSDYCGIGYEENKVAGVLFISE